MEEDMEAMKLAKAGQTNVALKFEIVQVSRENVVMFAILQVKSSGMIVFEDDSVIELKHCHP